MKIIINENQLNFINESNIEGVEKTSYEMTKSIALWCLLNEFRYFNPNRKFGNGTSVANKMNINKEICDIIMHSNGLETANYKKDLFRNSDENFTIYKVCSNGECLYIEVENDIDKHAADIAEQEYIDGENDNKIVKWFCERYF